eukprot:12410819-Karenia_brevis.AAC.1
MALRETDQNLADVALRMHAAEFSQLQKQFLQEGDSESDDEEEPANQSETFRAVSGQPCSAET